MVGSRELQSCLPKNVRLSLPRLPHVPRGRHPILVEIWLVQDGLIQVAGLTAHRWWELASGATGFGVGGSAGAVIGAGIGGATGAANGAALGMWLGPMGWLWGATAGAAAGATVGATVAATTGALRAAYWAAEAGRRTSETTSHVIGTYNEIIVTVPCRRTLPGGRSRDFSFVLGTYTDSPFSLIGERFVGWGYRKLKALGTRTNDGVLELKAGSQTPLRVVSRHMSRPLPPAALRSNAAHVLACLSKPLLGVLPVDRLMVSTLDRAFDEQSVTIAPVSARLESSDTFLPGLRGFATEVKAIGHEDPWGAFAVTGLPVTLSYPDDIEE
jgi:hypothetical protein